VPSGLADGLALKELRYAGTPAIRPWGRGPNRVPRSLWLLDASAIRLWVIIGTPPYMMSKISVTVGALGRKMQRCPERYPRRVASDYTPREVAELLRDERVQLIDVRQPHEHEAGRIAGGRLIELSELSAAADSIDRDRPVVFYCRSGGRSAMATEAFVQAGFDAHNMTGGMLEWQSDGLPMEPADGFVAEP
jgi:rhodanese-related sulfurtransferase